MKAEGFKTFAEFMKVFWQVNRLKLPYDMELFVWVFEFRLFADRR